MKHRNKVYDDLRHSFQEIHGKDIPVVYMDTRTAEYPAGWYIAVGPSSFYFIGSDTETALASIPYIEKQVVQDAWNYTYYASQILGYWQVWIQAGYTSQTGFAKWLASNNGSLYLDFLYYGLSGLAV